MNTPYLREYMRTIVFCILFCLLLADLSAQSISVKSFRLRETDLTAIAAGTMKRDQNNEVAALIKVVTTETGFRFDGGMLGIVGTKQQTGEIWVYVPQKARKISIYHPKMEPLIDYSYEIPIEAGRTYEMVLTTGKVTTIVQEDAGGQYVAMTVSPTNAEVYIDDVPVESSGGTLSKLLKYGKHTYRISAPLYESEMGQFEITSQGRTDLQVSLRPAYGQLQITSQPSGAQVYIDGNCKPAGTTPFTTERLRKGPHTLQFKLSSYKPLTEKVIVSGDGSVQSKAVTLAPNFAEVSVSVPGGAEIFINEESKGTGTWSGRLNTGMYRIEARKTSHYPTKRTVEVKAGENQKIDLQSPVPSYGSININTRPIGATVSVDGRELGESPNIFKEVLIGTHTLAVSKEGYATKTCTIEVEEGKVTPVDLQLENVGTVIIRSNVSNARVYVDGQYKGVEPYTHSDGAGRYQITVSAYGYKSKTQEINITAGDVSSTTLFLKAKRKRLMDYYDAGDLFSLGGGWDILWTDKCSMGGYLSFKIGQEQFTWLTAVVNIGGYKMGKSRGGKFLKDEGDPEIDEIDSENALTTYTQIPLSLALRLRLGGDDWGAMYVGAQGSYNFNTGGNVDVSVVNSRNYSVGGQIGFCAKRIFDFTLFFTYDLKPAYNQQYIYENMNDFYNNRVDHFNKRWRIGTSMVIYIPFSGER